MSEATKIKRRIAGEQVVSCNCNWGCPCQFNALPTTGRCEGIGACQINEGYFGNTRLDGVRFAGVAWWPGAIHEGNGVWRTIVDEQATKEQREALIFLGCAHETENKARLAIAEDIRLKKTLQNSITARFTGDWYWKTDCFVMQNLALLLTKIRSLVHEEISLLTVLYFPFRVRTPISASERHSMDTTQQPVAVVTGASSGIGLGVTQALLERGWRVVGTSRTISSSKDLTPSPDLVLVDGDVSKRGTAIKVVASDLKHLARLDLLVNNAGIYIPKAFTDYTEQDYNLVMNTNVASFFYMTQQVIPQMKKQNSGHVVSISGACVDQPSGAATELLALLSKAPMPAASKPLALEYAANNIRFITVSPAVVNTPMHAKRNHAGLAKLHPLARMGEVSGVGYAVLYLQVS